MIPSQQCFSAHDSLIHGGNAWLEVKLELIPFQSLPQAVDHDQRFEGLDVHFPRKELVAVTTMFLCPENGAIGILHQRSHIASIVGKYADPNACAGVDLAVLKGKGFL